MEQQLKDLTAQFEAFKKNYEQYQNETKERMDFVMLALANINSKADHNKQNQTKIEWFQNMFVKSPEILTSIISDAELKVITEEHKEILATTNDRPMTLCGILIKIIRNNQEKSNLLNELYKNRVENDVPAPVKAKATRNSRAKKTEEKAAEPPTEVKTAVNTPVNTVETTITTPFFKITPIVDTQAAIPTPAPAPRKRAPAKKAESVKK